MRQLQTAMPWKIYKYKQTPTSYATKRVSVNPIKIFIVFMQRSGLCSSTMRLRNYVTQQSMVLRRNGSTSTRRSLQQSTTPEDILHAKTISSMIIDHAAHGETKGGNGGRSLGYQSKIRQEEALTRKLRTGHQRPFPTSPSLKTLYASDWSNVDTEPTDMAEGEVSSPPGTFVELRR
jgi:hypothetical protein